MTSCFSYAIFALNHTDFHVRKRFFKSFPQTKSNETQTKITTMQTEPCTLVRLWMEEAFPYQEHKFKRIRASPFSNDWYPWWSSISCGSTRLPLLPSSFHTLSSPVPLHWTFCDQNKCIPTPCLCTLRSCLILQKSLPSLFSHRDGYLPLMNSDIPWWMCSCFHLLTIF